MSLDVGLNAIVETNVFDWNITHNLTSMANAAGIYKHLWRPDELGITVAVDLIEPLKIGLKELESSPDDFRKFNPENGWGNYENLVGFVKNYLESCINYPDAKIWISR